MKRLLVGLGALALLTWTALGLFAWSSAARRGLEGEESRAKDAAELFALRDELGVLHQDVRALASAMGENLQALEEAIRASRERSIDTAGGSASAELQSTALSASGVAASTERTTASGMPPPGAPADDGAKPRKSFLAFKLPSDDLRFDERRSWTVLPALSRVGFDAKSTLHDFTATTSELEGELEADLSRPSDMPRARVRVQAATLVSNNADRDEEMREILAIGQHPTFDFELTRFEPGEIELATQRATGEAHGRLSLRGVAQEVSMPVRLTLDDARRLCVEGEMTLDLTRFQVPVPNKLGLITMEKDVRVWISLRLRVNPRSKE